MEDGVEGMKKMDLSTKQENRESSMKKESECYFDRFYRSLSSSPLSPGGNWDTKVLKGLMKATRIPQFDIFSLL